MSSSFSIQPKQRQVNSSKTTVSTLSVGMNRSSIINAPVNKSSFMNRTVSSFIPTRATQTATRPGSSLVSKLQSPGRSSAIKATSSKLGSMRQASNSPAKTTRSVKLTARSAAVSSPKSTASTSVSAPVAGNIFQLLS